MLTLHHLEFELEATTRLGLYEYSGTALRAALFATLTRHFCPAPAGQTTHGDALHQAHCPVCWLLAREEPDATRGKDVPRALALRPPLGPKTDFHVGERWRFALTLFGDQAASLFPYLIVANNMMGEEGVGRRVDNGQRGRFALRRAWAVNPLTESRQLLLAEGSRQVQVPTLIITEDDVETATVQILRQLPARGGQLTVRFLTPTRLVDHKILVHAPVFLPLFQRTVERVIQLASWYGSRPPDTLDFDTLLPLADDVRLIDDRTQWVDLTSPSLRKGQSTPIGGFVGQAVYQAERWEPLLPWLLWGQLVQVGKNTVKGNGWFDLAAAGGRNGYRT